MSARLGPTMEGENVRIRATLVIALVALVGAACGDSETTTTTSEVGDTSATTTSTAVPAFRA